MAANVLAEMQVNVLHPHFQHQGISQPAMEAHQSLSQSQLLVAARVVFITAVQAAMVDRAAAVQRLAELAGHRQSPAHIFMAIQVEHRRVQSVAVAVVLAKQEV